MSPADGASEPLAAATGAAAVIRRGPGLSKPRRKSKTAVADGSITGDELLRRKRQSELGVGVRHNCLFTHKGMPDSAARTASSAGV